MTTIIYAIIGALISFLIRKLIVEPIERHYTQIEYIEKGYPKPDDFKKHIWF